MYTNTTNSKFAHVLSAINNYDEADQVRNQIMSGWTFSDKEMIELNNRFKLKFQDLLFKPKMSEQEEAITEKYGFFTNELQYSFNKNTGYTLKPTRINFIQTFKNHPAFAKQELYYSTFYNRNYINGEQLDNHHLRSINMELTRIYGTVLNDKEVTATVYTLCDENKKDELKEFFKSLPKTNTKHLDTWLIKYAGAEDTKLNRILGRKWLIQAAGRAMTPGEYTEGVLILQGDTAAGKTALFKTLVPNSEWFNSTQCDLDDEKKISETYANGTFIAEFGELVVLKKSNIEATKNNITSQSLTFRKPYAIESIKLKPRWVYAGTTNDVSYLSDSTGSERRFWSVVCVRETDCIGLKKILKELWKEALDAYVAGEQWTLTKEERLMLDEINDEAKIENPIFEELSNIIYGHSEDKITSYELHKKLGKVAYKEIANHMKVLGWKKKSYYDEDGKKVRGYVKMESK